MLYLKREGWNKAVYTASEIDDSSWWFLMDLENQQSLEKTENILLYSMSLNPLRYDLSNIAVPVIKENWTISGVYTINEGEVVIALNDVTVENDGISRLDCFGDLFVINGAVNGSIWLGGTPQIGNLEVNLPLSLLNTHFYADSTNFRTLLVNFADGYYNYTIKQFNTLETLEIGKLLIENGTTTATTTYSPDVNTVVYDPNK